MKQNESGMPESVASLLGERTASAIADVFRCIDVAEDESAKAQREMPKLARLLDDGFEHMVPTPPLEGVAEHLPLSRSYLLRQCAQQRCSLCADA